MEWIIVLLLVFSVLAGCITYNLTATEKTFVFFPYEMFKPINLYKNGKQKKYIIAFIFDFLVVLAVIFFCLTSVFYIF